LPLIGGDLVGGADIVLFLKQNGIDAYLPTIHEGETKKEYVVVRHAGRDQIPGISSSMGVYELLCYVPQNKGSELELYVDEVERIMIDLGKTMMIRTLNMRSPSYYDPDLRAHMISVSFRVYYKNN